MEGSDNTDGSDDAIYYCQNTFNAIVGCSIDSIFVRSIKSTPQRGMGVVRFQRRDVVGRAL